MNSFYLGPRSFGVDLNFPTSNHAFGLAEHATDLDLPSTTGPNSKYSSPYRLYNLDVFEYDMDSPMALYGSVPYLHLMSPQGSMGLLTLSASEMWIDIQRSHGIETHWMVESNPLEIYFWTAETPLALHSSFLHFTGLPYLPPLFSLGYHQSRWNYQSVDHVKEVDSQFDAFQIPYDVIWLDIEHTHEKRYFTWDPVKFKNHSLMIHDLALKHRRLVTIIDPHIKVDPNYFVSAEAAQHDVFVKSKDHQVFHGHCWPGDSNWIDFTQSKAVDVWIQFFSKEKNPQGIETFTWNDMNEPSVFSGPEITLPKDTLHGMYEHRDVHNLYGTLFHRATMLGQLNRGTSLRPFVLSRAFFVGTQKYGAVWTGDNMSKWSHLEASLPMLLSLSISGIHFSGADVGGFFGDPENELMVRWYQTAALQPFFRGHGHIDTKFREPYLFKDHAIVREAILLRYRLMPMLYTVFAQQVRSDKIAL
ncbi:hypothetical protein HMI55_002965 [Coelomomyces lativittatus]|nr:hypothetical protein HMI55_002965 [Coelomomyces lativittatus]